MSFIKKIPIPMAGLILAIVSLGNFMLQRQFDLVGHIFVWIAILLTAFLTLRVVMDFQSIKQELKNPMIAAVAPTFTMATFGIAAYIHQFENFILLANVLWYGAIVLHLGFMAHFTYHFVIKHDLTLQSLYPSWFITYIGIGVITFTSPTFNLLIGQIFFVLAIINYVVLVPLMIYRLIKTHYNELAAMPLLTILTAPTSLCLAGYLAITDVPNTTIVASSLIVSQILFFFALYFLHNIFKLAFYPSFAAFTFPLVITGIATTLAHDVLQWPYFQFVAYTEVAIAIVITGIVFVRYLAFLFIQKKEAPVAKTVKKEIEI
ncbi:TDT family transporter [Kurthia sp. FSL E2-0154]|uniref:TDT family transporter n=1 Tax=Kurthia sp. FSL E2-0154 TaxID=2921358 RepID=UPI0030F6363A